MRVESTSPQQITNVPDAAVEYRVGNLEIIMELLSKLYSKPIHTPIKEYCANARDANREANAKTPIRIVIPSRLEPTLRIRDYGNGLSPEQVREVFTVYGCSTKTHTNSQTGGFGIGAKSAWAYTDSFTVTSWHGGTKRMYLCHKSGGTASMQLLSEEASDAPTGVEIGIAAKPGDLQTFKEAVSEAVKCWQPEERPTVVGMDITWADFGDKYKICDGIYCIEDRASNYGDKIILDGFVYKCPIDIKIRGMHKRVAVVANTGDVDPAPTREALKNNDKLDKFVAQIRTQIYNEMQQRMANLKKDSKTAVEFFKHQTFDWFNMPGNTTFRGLTFDGWRTHTYNGTIFLPVSLRRKTIKYHDTTDSISKLEHIYYDDLPNKRERAAHLRGLRNTTTYLNILTDQSLIAEFGALPLSSVTPIYNTTTRNVKTINNCEFQAWKNGVRYIYKATDLPSTIHYLPGQNRNSRFAAKLYGTDIYALSKKAVDILTTAGKTLVDVSDCQKNYVPNKDDLLYMGLKYFYLVRSAVDYGFLSLNYNEDNVIIRAASEWKWKEIMKTKEYIATRQMVNSLHIKHKFALTVVSSSDSEDRKNFKKEYTELFK
jgi:hypothetical protein